MHDKVARLRELMRDAVPRGLQQKATEPPELQASRAFELYSFNADAIPAIEQTPRARLEREILRIASWYNWGGEISRALDAAKVATLSALTEDQADALVTRLKTLETCVQEGLDCPDAPPAR